MVLDDGSIGLIDFGQVKRISSPSRVTLARIMLALTGNPFGNHDDDPKQSSSSSSSSRHSNRTLPSSSSLSSTSSFLRPGVDLNVLTTLAEELGVELKEGAQPEGAAAAAMWLFDGAMSQLPGGYSTNELSKDSPIKELKSFPQDLVMVGRNTILIKGVASRLGLTSHSLAMEWVPIANKLLFDPAFGAALGKRAQEAEAAEAGSSISSSSSSSSSRAVRAWRKTKAWAGRRATALGTRLPSRLRRAAASVALKLEDRRGGV
jgi:hypothetical protein